MANEGNDQLLMRVAVLGITFSIICTLGLSLMINYGSDYDYDSIASYRNDLIDFSGESMINETPWVLTHVYTPYAISPYGDSDDMADHVDDDGWLYGVEITDYPYLNQSANIRLDPGYKSSVPITVSAEKPTVTFQDGFKWWADNPIDFITKPIGEFFGNDPYQYKSETVSVWDFTGYRFVLDPTLPFGEASEDNPTNVSSRDGSLSLVWYDFNGLEGLSGGLQIYNGDVLLASYAASDIIADYNLDSAYATVYNFTFEGVLLHLSIRFDPRYAEIMPLQQAWSSGYWSMAISSTSAGNFFDIDNSASFANTAGGAIDTFIKIYTWDLPQISNPWAMTMIWLMVGLPMTIAMLCVTLRMLSAVRLF